jgi:hypothetical protein
MFDVLPVSDEEDDTRVLLYNDFLVSPRLSVGGEYTERKFSGSDDFQANSDTLGRIIDALAHHVIVDSKGTLMLADIQGDLKALLCSRERHY